MARVPSIVLPGGGRDVAIGAVGLRLGVDVAGRDSVLAVVHAEGRVLATGLLLLVLADARSGSAASHVASGSLSGSPACGDGAAGTTGHPGRPTYSGAAHGRCPIGAVARARVGPHSQCPRSGQSHLARSCQSRRSHARRAAQAEGPRPEHAGPSQAGGEGRLAAGASVDTPQRVVAIGGRGGGVAADDAVGVAIAVDAGVQQVDAHEILGVGDGVEARARLALRNEVVGDPRRGHGPAVDVSLLVESARVEARVRSPQAGSAVVGVAVARVDSGLVRRGVQVAVLDVSAHRGTRRTWIRPQACI